MSFIETIENAIHPKHMDIQLGQTVQEQVVAQQEVKPLVMETVEVPEEDPRLEHNCPSCGGEGLESNSKLCPRCHGTGKI